MGLQIYINLDDQNRVVVSRNNATPSAAYRLKGGGETTVDFRFVRGGQVVSLGVSPTFRFAAKAEGERDSDPILESLADKFTVIETVDDYYARMELNANTVALWDLFASDEDPENDILLAALDCELKWTVSGKTNRTPSGFSLLMENPVIRDEDNPPMDTEVTYPDPTEILVDGDVGVSVAPLDGAAKLPAANLPTTALVAGDVGTSVAGLVAGLVPDGNVKNWAITTGRPAASVTPAANGDLEIEATSNTQLKFKFKGSDGTVRSVTLTLD